MKIVNFGSLNIDHVYDVEHFVRPGETIPSLAYQRLCGGKGLNQSIALAQSGSTVQHSGKIGGEGKHLLEKLSEFGVDVGLVASGPHPTGHAIIQVSPTGENSIIVEGGSNRTIDSSDIDRIVSSLSENDWLLLQNEINAIDQILEATRNHPCTVVFNPAPMTGEVARLPLELVDILILNEIEGAGLTGEADPSLILNSLLDRYPNTKVVVTLGKNGAVYLDQSQQLHQAGFEVEPIDTTAAGDTFVGYFVTSLSSGHSAEESLRIACRASSICVTRRGAADSIPSIKEVLENTSEQMFRDDPPS